MQVEFLLTEGEPRWRGGPQSAPRLLAIRPSDRGRYGVQHV